MPHAIGKTCEHDLELVEIENVDTFAEKDNHTSSFEIESLIADPQTNQNNLSRSSPLSLSLESVTSLDESDIVSIVNNDVQYTKHHYLPPSECCHSDAIPQQSNVTICTSSPALTLGALLRSMETRSNEMQVTSDVSSSTSSEKEPVIMTSQDLIDGDAVYAILIYAWIFFTIFSF